MLGHRTSGRQRVVIRATKQRLGDLLRCTDKRINRVHGAHHRHLLAVRFGYRFPIMCLNRYLGSGPTHGNPLAIGTDHAQGPFGLWIRSGAGLPKRAHRLSHLEVHPLQTIDGGMHVQDTTQRLGHPTIGVLHRETLCPILQQVGKVTLGQL